MKLSERECMVLYSYLCELETNIQECQWEVEPNDPDYEVMNTRYEEDRKIIRNIRIRLEVLSGGKW